MGPLATVPKPHDTVRLLADALAGRHSVSPLRGSRKEIERLLDDLDRAYSAIYHRLQTDPQCSARHPRIAEWLLDNEYLIRDHLRQVGEALPPAHYRRLPRLQAPEGPDVPRILALARETVAESRLQFDVERLERFLRRYQDTHPLNIAELWALPALLRLAVLECVSRIVLRTLGMTAPSDTRPERERRRSDVAARALGVQAEEGGRGPALRGTGGSRAEQAALTGVAAGIGSLRALGDHDWKRFVESVSAVDRVLRRDPARVYGRMEFETRDAYRRAVEELARGSPETEQSVAVEALRFARHARMHGGGREAHVGYYLVGDGRGALETRVRYRPRGRARLRRLLLRRAGAFYFGLIGALAALAEAGFAVALHGANVAPAALAVLLLVGVVPAVSVAVSLVNWLATVWVPPRVLPRLDLSKGIPEDCRTVVAVPVLVRQVDEIDGLLSHLEMLYHGNADPNISWALLTDFADAPEKEMPDDEVLLRRAAEGIERLNRAFGKQDAPPFVLLHRERRWNPAEGYWMGWERKRGKLHQLNRLLLGDAQAGLEPVAGEVALLEGVRFVITLDADTHLPPGTAARLIGTLAHPLNVAAFDEGGRVRTGYTVVQPAVETGVRDDALTPFVRIMEADSGYDLYSHAVSNVYQDLFGEGIYEGKGIYDVAGFERSLEGRVPENALLSHDLFEGIHGRAALASDIQVFEEHPADVISYMRRLHRWIRGDWQILPWLGPRVPAAGGGRVPNRLGVLDRWKILDNLRRSLVAPSLLALALAGWIGGFASPWLWTGILAGVLGVPSFLGAASATRRRIGNRRAGRWRTSTARGPLNPLAPATWTSVERWLLALVLLPYEALVALDAIIRTLVRLKITHRHLLEWTTAAHAGPPADRRGSTADHWKSMAAVPVLAAGTLAALAALDPASLPAGIGPAVLWLLSPQISAHLSRPLRRARPRTLAAGDERLLRIVALRTWTFFERLVDPEEHWLPPDNYQEGRKGGVARRTSPTNIGMMLAASVSAFDLGYIGPLELEAMSLNALESMSRLHRYRGHFLNWYSTEDLRPLEPRYVSTVDSGNLAAALLVLRQGALDAARRPILRPELLLGLEDTLASACEVVAAARPPGLRRAAGAVIACLRKTEERVRATRQRARAPGAGAREWTRLLDHLESEALPDLDAAVETLSDAAAEAHRAELLGDLRVWVHRVHRHVTLLRRLAKTLCPWLELIAAPPASLGAAFPGDSGEGLPWRELQELLGAPLSPAEISGVVERARGLVDRLEKGCPPGGEEMEGWLRHLRAALESAERASRRLERGLRAVARTASSTVEEMEFGFLFDPDRKLFHIGFNVSTEEHDPNYYDLLASEARLASYLAIALGQVPREHWLQLGRPFARVGDSRVLLSWGATMFEYLLPNLFLKLPPRSLLDVSCRAAVRQQIRFARRRGVPWGISESGYHEIGGDESYQYRAFGVPQLGLKRGLGERLVIAPYASLLALSIAPKKVVRNLRRLIRVGMLGPMGLYEAADFGPTDRREWQRPKLVRSHMAHHQGMILVAIGNWLAPPGTVARLHADPRIAGIEFLLNERTPGRVPVREAWTDRWREAVPAAPAPPALLSWPTSLASAVPETLLLGNGSLAVLVTNTGGGGLLWRGLAATRWAPDPTLDETGTFVYVQDAETGEVWSAGFAPTGAEPESMHIRFAPHMAEFRRHDRGVALRMRIGVAADDDVEIRHLTLTNESGRARRLRATSYGEVVLSPEEEHERHPAYSRLFVESSFEEETATLVFRRRPRSPDERRCVLAHTVVVPAGAGLPELSFETDRRLFLGRGGSVRDPAALRAGPGGLSGTTGATLDPIFAIGATVELAPGESRQLAFVTAVGETRSAAVAALEFYRSFGRVTGSFDFARQGLEHTLHEMGIEPQKVPHIHALLSVALRPTAALRADGETLRRNRRSQPALWKFGISGDHPIVLAEIGGVPEIHLAKELLAAHRYWRARGLVIDLVLLDLEAGGYERPLRDRLRKEVEEAEGGPWIGRPGGIHLIGVEECEEPDRILLESVAAVVLKGDRGELREQLRHARRPLPRLPAFVPVPHAPLTEEPTPPLEGPGDLLFFNGIGGFTPDGREYVIRLRPDERTPAPWTNVIANPEFGCLVSEAGLGCTWSLHASENRLTPWRNDPVADAPAEVLYLRDEETATLWSATPLPAGGEAEYEVRHGAGYSAFRHHRHGLLQQLTVFCPPDAPLKIVRLRITNRWERHRRLTATFYAEWMLGSRRPGADRHLVPEYDRAEQVLLARNPFRQEYAERTAFLFASEPPHGLTTDRTEFLGEHGDPARPAALDRIGLSDAVVPGADPCAAVQVHVDMRPGETREIHFVLGQEKDRDSALARVREYRDPAAVEAAWERLRGFWDGLLDTLAVETPDAAMNVALNRWLPAQALACRLWARTALYQSSGAFGFRDQLQDVIALAGAAPELTRAHILEAAARQFLEGDVLHWWHPGTTTGVRSRCSDDLLWLPYAVCEYVRRTGDTSILDEPVPYLRGPDLEPDEAEHFGHFEATRRKGPVYEHCVRALERGATRGPHGLPLIGSGDWNDGMNRVGLAGTGESVWLGWFLIAVLGSFADLARRRKDERRARTCEKLAEGYRERIEESAWDGAWYLRAFYDDGAPLGSASDREARIDAISQAWAVLSGAAPRERARQALESAWRELVRERDRLVLLLAPPFDRTERDPGYIKGYPPGVRENGGQYTHAAVWLAWAFAELGDGERAARLFRYLNPVGRATTPDELRTYRLEPYVVAADIYGAPPHTGRGGWSWYTGSAAWLYRLGVEGILGLRREGDRLRIAPCLPPEWPGYGARLRVGGAEYRIRVDNSGGPGRGIRRVLLDAKELETPEGVEGAVVPLRDDADIHEVLVELGGREVSTDAAVEGLSARSPSTERAPERP